MVSLVHKIANNNDPHAQQIAEAIVLRWQKIEFGLCPIIGRRGVAALYKRSLHLTSQTYPWLASTDNGINFAAFKVALEQQNSADAIAAGDALLETFYELFSTLVGSSLSERLLFSVTN